MGGQLSFWLLLMSCAIKLGEPLKFGEPMKLDELVRLYVDTVPLEFENQKSINDEINYLMDYTMTLMMSSAKVEFIYSWITKFYKNLLSIISWNLFS